MTLLNPAALLYAILVGVLLFFHLRRKPRVIHWVSNLELWSRVDEVQDFAAARRRIRRNLLLILQVLFMLAVIVALARPELRTWTSRPRTVVFVVDCSASMGAREGGATRLERAKAAALGMTDGIGVHDSVLIIQARPRLRVDRYQGQDVRGIRGALQALSGTEAPADLGKAVQAGLAAVSRGEPYEMLLFSDGAGGEPLPAAAPGGRIRVIRTGGTGDNVAITRLAVRDNPFSRYDPEIFAELTNFSKSARRFRFELTFADAPLLTEEVTLEAGARRAFAVKAPSGTEGVIRARADLIDSLDADNHAFALVSAGRIPVLLVTEGNAFLESVLAVNPQVAAWIVRPEEFLAQPDTRGCDVVILDGLEPRRLPPGNYLVIRPPRPGAPGADLLRDLKSLVVTRPGHPITAFAGLQNVIVDEAAPLEIPAGSVSLVESNGRSLLTASEDGVARTVTLGFDLRASNLPLTVSFPVLISNILRWLTSEGSNPGNQVEAGSVFRWRVPGSAGPASAAVTTPSGRIAHIPTAGGMLSFADTENTGIYAVRYGSRDRRFAVNLFDPGESDLGRIPPAAGKEGGSEGPAALARAGSEIWRWLLLAALALLGLEWFFYQRQYGSAGASNPAGR